MIKYYCDSCNIEVFDEYDLFTCKVPKKIANGNVIIDTWHICESCVNILNIFLKYGMVEEPCDTVVSSK